MSDVDREAYSPLFNLSDAPKVLQKEAMSRLNLPYSSLDTQEGIFTLEPAKTADVQKTKGFRELSCCPGGSSGE